MNVRTFWWRGKNHPNLGDDIAPILLERVFKIHAQFEELGKAELLSVGSLLGFAIESKMIPARNAKVHIVGSGLMRPALGANVPEQLKIHSLRGLYSRNIVSNDNIKVSVGDPGLLAPLATPLNQVRQSEKIGVILHHSHAENPSVRGRFDHLPVDLIDIRTNDLDNFFERLSQYKLILSESLHGLIFADSISIPNVWLSLKSLHSGGKFKFYDYFSTTGRDPLLVTHRIPDSISELSSYIFEAKPSRVRNLQRDIVESYEEALSDLKHQSAGSAI